MDILYGVHTLDLLFNVANRQCSLSSNILTLGNCLCQACWHARAHLLDLRSPFLDNCHQKLISIHFYLFSEFQFVVISLNTLIQGYFIRIVILKLTNITNPDISVSFLLSVPIIEANNESNIRKYDKNNWAYFSGLAFTAFSFWYSKLALLCFFRVCSK